MPKETNRYYEKYLWTVQIVIVMFWVYTILNAVNFWKKDKMNNPDTDLSPDIETILHQYQEMSQLGERKKICGFLQSS